MTGMSILIGVNKGLKVPNPLIFELSGKTCVNSKTKAYSSVDPATPATLERVANIVWHCARFFGVLPHYFKFFASGKISVAATLPHSPIRPYEQCVVPHFKQNME